MMNDEINLEQMRFIISEMEDIQRQNPTAKVIYDANKNRINIVFPLPRDYWNIESIRFNDNEK